MGQSAKKTHRATPARPLGFLRCYTTLLIADGMGKKVCSRRQFEKQTSFFPPSGLRSRPDQAIAFTCRVTVVLPMHAAGRGALGLSLAFNHREPS